MLRAFPPSERYLIGVSGGRDSVALLHWLLRAGYRRLIVAHLNHRLRGRASAADARFVQRLAEEHQLACEVADADVHDFASEYGQSVETAARALRYAFFVNVARRRRCRTIFLGHHADDLVETFLFNLFRGGTIGRTTKPVTRRTIGRTALTVVRPLLCIWRREIDHFVAQERIAFREDASNTSLDSTRNRMRHRVIPMLEKEFGRDIRQALLRAAMIAGDEDAFLETLQPKPEETLKVRSLGQQPIALQRRILRSWLQQHHVADVSFELIERVRGLLETQASPAKVNLPGDGHARRRAGELFIEKHGA